MFVAMLELTAHSLTVAPSRHGAQHNTNMYVYAKHSLTDSSTQTCRGISTIPRLACTTSPTAPTLSSLHRRPKTLACTSYCAPDHTCAVSAVLYGIQAICMYYTTQLFPSISILLSINQRLESNSDMCTDLLTLGEWEFGGFPAWLISIEPQITLRTYETGYINAVNDWWEVLLPTIRPMLIQNGGNIIMMQIENEFGSVLLCSTGIILCCVFVFISRSL